MSVDTHKFGMAHKGTSVVLYRSPDVRRHQFTQVGWDGWGSNHSRSVAWRPRLPVWACEIARSARLLRCRTLTATAVHLLLDARRSRTGAVACTSARPWQAAGAAR